MRTGRKPQHETAAPAAAEPALRGGDEDTPVRRILLALILFGAVGLGAELLLLEHTGSIWQWIPLVTLGSVLASGAAAAVRPTARTVRVFRGLMLAVVAVGLLGLFLHYDGNMEFELEMDPAMRGFELAWRSLAGATPALAPGAMIQLGLLGLVYAYRHPALRRV